MVVSAHHVTLRTPMISALDDRISQAHRGTGNSEFNTLTSSLRILIGASFCWLARCAWAGWLAFI